ncbi:MAG: S8 family serine peptidase [Candidatus Muiribacteriota bacterium]
MKKTIIVLVLFLTFFVVSAENGRYIIRLKDSDGFRKGALATDMSNRKDLLIRRIENHAISSSNFLNYSDITRQLEVVDSLWFGNTIIAENIDDEVYDYLKNMPYVLDIFKDTKGVKLVTPMGFTGTGSAASKYTHGLNNLQIPRIWKEFNITGKNVNVGIMDAMFDRNHPELKDKIIKWYDINGSDNPPADSSHHGSHVAGTIVGGNLSGLHIGVAPDSKFYFANIFGGSNETFITECIKAMQFIADPDGNPATNDFPRVVNNSWDYSHPSGALLLYPYIDEWVNLGIIPVFAAGNEGYEGVATVGFLASHKDTIAVGAVDAGFSIAGFSSIGPGNFCTGSYFNPINNETYYYFDSTQKPDFTAPGVSVLSSINDNQYAYANGTSMAAPHITGVIALLLQAKPELTLAQIKDILYKSCSDVGMAGYDIFYGHGFPNAYTAVGLALSGCKWSPKPKTSYSYPSMVTFDGNVIINPDAGHLKGFKIFVNDVEKHSHSYSPNPSNGKMPTVGRIYTSFFRDKNFGGSTPGFVPIDKLGKGEHVFKIVVEASNGADLIHQFSEYFY